MEIKDPDLVVNWERVDEPGDEPTWESKCGIVVQKTVGTNSTFHGFVGPERIPVPQAYSINLIGAKQSVEREYLKNHDVAWDYKGDEDRAMWKQT